MEALAAGIAGLVLGCLFVSRKPCTAVRTDARHPTHAVAALSCRQDGYGRSRRPIA